MVDITFLMVGVSSMWAKCPQNLVGITMDIYLSIGKNLTIVLHPLSLCRCTLLVLGPVVSEHFLSVGADNFQENA